MGILEPAPLIFGLEEQTGALRTMPIVQLGIFALLNTMSISIEVATSPFAGIS